MSSTQQSTQMPRCNDCGGELKPIATNTVGRPVYACQQCESTQVGPFA